jgi:hypothetical protein
MSTVVGIPLGVRIRSGIGGNSEWKKINEEI